MSPRGMLTAALKVPALILHLARRLLAQLMLRMLTLTLKNFRTIILPSDRSQMSFDNLVLPTHMARPRIGLRRNGTPWPLARLMFPIKNLKKQMETLLQTYCLETAVTCHAAEAQSPLVKRMAIHLSQFMATYLAETVTALFQSVLSHPAKGLVNGTNAALLTQKFWVQAIYTELLHASSRFRAVRKEQQRPPNGLVKVVCLPYDGTAEQKHGRKKASDASFETMVGMSSWVGSLFIWFPAAWMPLVVEAIREKTLLCVGGTGQRGAVASTDLHQPEIPSNREFSFKIKRWQVDKSGSCPILQSRVNVDWLTFDPNIFTLLFRRVYDGMLHDVFIQKASMAWHNAPYSRIMVSLLLPRTMEAEDWLYLARDNRHMWPLDISFGCSPDLY